MIERLDLFLDHRLLWVHPLILLLQYVKQAPVYLKQQDLGSEQFPLCLIFRRHTSLWTRNVVWHLQPRGHKRYRRTVDLRWGHIIWLRSFVSWLFIFSRLPPECLSREQKEGVEEEMTVTNPYKSLNSLIIQWEKRHYQLHTLTHY